MKRALTVCALVLVAIAATPRPAQAWALWDWMQEWSGPGPFTGDHPMVLYCSRPRLLPPGDPRPPCWFVDVRQLVADENDNFPVKVSVKFFDVGRSWPVQVGPLRESVEAGIGVGLMVAAGDELKGVKTALRPTLI